MEHACDSGFGCLGMSWVVGCGWCFQGILMLARVLPIVKCVYASRHEDLCRSETVESCRMHVDAHKSLRNRTINI
jgi:hypothetical protein